MSKLRNEMLSLFLLSFPCPLLFSFPVLSFSMCIRWKQVDGEMNGYRLSGKGLWSFRVFSPWILGCFLKFRSFNQLLDLYILGLFFVPWFSVGHLDICFNYINLYVCTYVYTFIVCIFYIYTYVHTYTTYTTHTTTSILGLWIFYHLI